MHRTASSSPSHLQSINETADMDVIDASRLSKSMLSESLESMHFFPRASSTAATTNVNIIVGHKKSKSMFSEKSISVQFSPSISTDNNVPFLISKKQRVLTIDVPDGAKTIRIHLSQLSDPKIDWVLKNQHEETVDKVCSDSCMCTIQ